MTRDEILALQPGEELDRLVALTFEKQPRYELEDWEREWIENEGINDPEIDDYFNPHNGYWILCDAIPNYRPIHFSTDEIVALRLWDAIVAKGLFVDIYRDKDVARVEIVVDYQVWDSTWMLALAKAWLMRCEAHP